MAPDTAPPGGQDRVTDSAAPYKPLDPEPFVQFPLWGLRKALTDHVARCRACAIEQPGCTDDWYAGMLRDKIERATRAH